MKKPQQIRHYPRIMLENNIKYSKKKTVHKNKNRPDWITELLSQTSGKTIKEQIYQ